MSLLEGTKGFYEAPDHRASGDTEIEQYPLERYVLPIQGAGLMTDVEGFSREFFRAGSNLTAIPQGVYMVRILPRTQVDNRLSAKDLVSVTPDADELSDGGYSYLDYRYTPVYAKVTGRNNGFAVQPEAKKAIEATHLFRNVDDSERLPEGSEIEGFLIGRPDYSMGIAVPIDESSIEDEFAPGERIGRRQVPSTIDLSYDFSTITNNVATLWNSIKGLNQEELKEELAMLLDGVSTMPDSNLDLKFNRTTGVISVEAIDADGYKSTFSLLADEVNKKDTNGAIVEIADPKDATVFAVNFDFVGERDFHKPSTTALTAKRIIYGQEDIDLTTQIQPVIERYWRNGRAMVAQRQFKDLEGQPRDHFVIDLQGNRERYTGKYPVLHRLIIPAYINTDNQSTLSRIWR